VHHAGQERPSEFVGAQEEFGAGFRQAGSDGDLVRITDGQEVTERSQKDDAQEQDECPHRETVEGAQGTENLPQPPSRQPAP
jgi:hypothetical protein